jgi:hypothetical protein
MELAKGLVVCCDFMFHFAAYLHLTVESMVS